MMYWRPFASLFRFFRITGLDPAGLGFDRKPAAQRLNSKSAVFVDVIHTDPTKYGIKSSVGVVDFWANYRHFGPVRQPGCSNEATSIFSLAGTKQASTYNNAIHSEILIVNLKRYKYFFIQFDIWKKTIQFSLTIENSIWY